MELRNFGGRCGLQVNPVSIGAMRLPEKLDDAVALLRRAIDGGMCYIDTSRGYGDSEIKVGEALKDGYRSKVFLSTKWSPWIMKVDPSDDNSAGCIRRRIEECMRRLQVDYLDFFQVWNITEEEHYQQAIAKGGMVDGIHKAMDEGLVRHTGFTAHAQPELLLRILPEMDWAEIMLVSYNILGAKYAPVLTKARQLGIGTVVMNPMGGGRLSEHSEVFRPLWEASGCHTMPEVSIRYILANMNIDTLVSGISKTADVDSTLAAAKKGPLTRDAVQRIEDFVSGLAPEKLKFCTQCNYCMPCPYEVNIPWIMEGLYQYEVLGFQQSAQLHYQWLEHVPWAPGKRTGACQDCGVCVEKCTQHLDIPQLMRKAKTLLEVE